MKPDWSNLEDTGMVYVHIGGQYMIPIIFVGSHKKHQAIEDIEKKKNKISGQAPWLNTVYAMRKQAENTTVNKSKEVEKSYASSTPCGLHHHPSGQASSCTVGWTKLVVLGCDSTINVAWINQYSYTFLL